MSKITVYINRDSTRDRAAVLGMNVRSFIERATGKKPGPVYIEPTKLSREWIRTKMLDLITLAVFTSPTENRRQADVFEEVVSSYGTRVGIFIEENLDLIAEIKLSAESGIDSIASRPQAR